MIRVDAGLKIYLPFPFPPPFIHSCNDHAPLIWVSTSSSVTAYRMPCRSDRTWDPRVRFVIGGEASKRNRAALRSHLKEFQVPEAFKRGVGYRLPLQPAEKLFERGRTVRKDVWLGCGFAGIGGR